MLQEEPSSSDRTGKPVTEEEQHVRNHDNSGKPEREEILQENYHLKSRDNVDKFDLATDDANVDFSVSGIPEEAVKRSENFNILQLIRRITRHPQKQAVQSDLDKEQSFNAFSDESKRAIKEAGNIEISEIVNAEPKWQCKSCLNHCNPGVIYCVCGRLMTNRFGRESKVHLIHPRLILHNRASTSEKTDHVVTGMEKLQDAKNTIRQINLQRNAVKRNTKASTTGTSATRAFRKAMIDHGRTEQTIIEMDKLAKEDHSYKAQQGRNRVLPWQLVDPLECGTR